MISGIISVNPDPIQNDKHVGQFISSDINLLLDFMNACNHLKIDSLTMILVIPKTER